MSDSWLVLVTNPKDAAIASYRLADGQLEPLARTEGLPGTGTFVVAEEQDLVFAGVKGDPAQILTLRLDRATGELVPLSRRAIPGALAYLALSPDGRYLLGASYHAGLGLVWPIGADGELSDPVAKVEHPNAHCIVPCGENAYLVSLGADLIAQYRLTTKGALVPLEPATVAAPTGSGPRHLIFSADGRHGYLITEFTGEAIHFLRDAGTGTLTRTESLPGYDVSRGLGRSRYGADPQANHFIWGADLQLAQGERRLLCSERTESTITSLEVDAQGRLVRQLTWTDTLRQPRGFWVVPGTDLVLITGEGAAELDCCRLGADGGLTLLSQAPTGVGANWVRAIKADLVGQ